DYIKNVELRGDLFDYYKELKLMNNYIQRMRQIGIPKGANDMVNVIASIEMGKNIQKAEELIKELKKEIGKI
ncbi:hypothetical protein HY643_05240, partial [Candidatus Woesearchaeota archaeon]|nr:hypothetical protein [Candidatus Woesearchaeota archaeon]